MHVLTAMMILVFLFPCLGDNDVHVCDAQRHGHASLPVFTQDVHNLASPREEQSRSLHHLQEHPMSYREPRRVRNFHEELQLVFQRRVSQVRLLMSERPNIHTKSELLMWAELWSDFGFSLAAAFIYFNCCRCLQISLLQIFIILVKI